MTELKGKRVAASRTEQVQILTMNALNGYNRLFGGRLMEWIDVVAAVAARRHSGMNVTTACVDNLRFGAAAYANDTVILSAEVTRAWRTSMEVCVRTYVEELSGERREINRAYLVMVALDENEKPAPVPPVLPQTEAEWAEFEAAQRRREVREAAQRA